MQVEKTEGSMVEKTEERMVGKTEERTVERMEERTVERTAGNTEALLGLQSLTQQKHLNHKSLMP